MIRANFSKDIIPKNLPEFYKMCLSVWSELVSQQPDSPGSVLIQPLWNNKYIKIGGTCTPVYNSRLADQGVHLIGDIINCDGTFKKWQDINLNTRCFFRLHECSSDK